VSPSDRWTGGDAYEAYIGRWSRPVGRAFVAWLDVPPGARWLDVGCGTGALTATILATAAPERVVAIDPSSEFVDHARRAIGDDRAAFAVGSAAAVPVANATIDAAVSGLVLNFVPDLAAGLSELRRVVVPGGIVAGYVWDYADGMELVRRFWDAAVELDPAAAAMDEAVRFPICAPDPLRAALRDAGLREVAVEPIEVPTVFADFDDLWTPFLSGVGPAPGYALQLGDARRAALEERLRAMLPAEPDGSIHLRARAWAVRGVSDGPISDPSEG
jgi:SAM-dependent methyltransferase